MLFINETSVRVLGLEKEAVLNLETLVASSHV